ENVLGSCPGESISGGDMKLVFTGLMLTAVLAGSGHAAKKPADEGALAQIQHAGVLRIGTTGDYKPFSYKTADGTLVGADIEMAKDLAATLGVRPEFVPTTWKTLLDDFKGGKFDVALGGITVNPDRAAVGDFS